MDKEYLGNKKRISVLFVSLHRPNRSPSQRFRFEQYIDILEKEGYSCKQAYLLDEKKDKIFYSSRNYLRKLLILFKSAVYLFKLAFTQKNDIVFVQREAFMLGSSFFERKFSKSSKMIFDFDDTIWMHQTGKVRSKNKFLYFLKRPEKTREIIEAADMVFAGNKYLCEFASKYNNTVRLIPTTINTQWYKLVSLEDTDRICIGWSGSFSTVIHFEYIIDALRQLKAKYGERIYFKLIGDPSYANKELDIKGIKWTAESEVDDLEELDIGIMPLPEDEWTNGKCGCKGLQYMALGIPTIMSPVGVNKEIISDGVNGYLASSINEWVEKISLLIESFETRKRIGLAGRKTVVDHYSVEANKNLYLKYFKELAN